MNQTKPKKALRGLFTKTEPDQIENIAYPEKTTKEPIVEAISSNSKRSHSTNVELNLNSEDSIDKMEKEYTITKIQYNFDRLRSERNSWNKHEYVNFLTRIDNAQTEAFFLKGKLIAEIKERFFEGNKMGWKNFCEDTLNMNYTTANQYIRVAQEFDVTSHQRTDFGFEHFKALLPLPSQDRSQIIESLPQSISVKSLRNLVSLKTDKKSPNKATHNNKINLKNITENLEKIKLQLDNLDLNSLDQTEKWSLLGAFRSISEEMSDLAELLSKSQESRYTRHMGATILQNEEDHAT
ncbi:hypothetical protein [Fluviispira multicolorata]|uniref:Uncharacterized protein n=1 Tax=Fluviispira multicolorata TaxID=2654512 RepID=A0A833JCC8_9BACT|nr:hypothetical protein [Fluviispira multicolorata]KAB8030656.1 hypothetical protein GCL57_06690 [Fluviispira multicolorata]